KADSGKYQADPNEFRFPEFLDQSSGPEPLKYSADNPTVSKKIGDRARRAARVAKIQMKIISNQQRQGAFKTTETESGQKEDHHQQPRFGRAQSMPPLLDVRTLGGIGGSRLTALGKDEKGQYKIRRAE